MKKWISLVLVSSVLAVCAVSALAAEKSKEQVIVTGVVADSNGKAIPNAQVYCVPPNSRLDLPPAKAMLTDAEGKVTFSTTRDQMDYYVAVAKGYSYARAPIKEGSTQLDYTLWPERVIKGKVVDELGRPVAGATVKMDSYCGSPSGGVGPNINQNSYSFPKYPQIFDVVADKDGLFKIERLPEPSLFYRASLRLETSKKGHATMMRWLFSADVRNPGKNDFNDEIKLLCPTACTLEGKLNYPRNLHLTSKRFYLSTYYETNQGKEFCNRYLNVGQSGKYKIENLPPGKITLELLQADSNGDIMPKPECGPPAIRDIVLKPGEVKKLDVVIQHGAVVSGTLLDAETGKPMHSQLDIQHSGFHDDSYVATVNSDEEGKFTFRAPAGDVKLELAYATKYNISDIPRLVFQVTDGETKSVVFNVPRPKAASAAK